MTGPRVAVVGAAILGAALAFRLSQGGARVTVVEATGPAAGASGRSFGWINASFFATPAHHHLRAAAMAAHRRLDAELEPSPTRWPGCLWYEHQGAAFDAQAETLAALGYPLRELDRAAFAEREPHIAHSPARSLLFPAEGATDAAALTRRLLAAAAAFGARQWIGPAVTGFQTAGGRITAVATDAGLLAADHTILAAGTGAAALLATLGLHLPMLQRPGLLMRTKPVPPLLRHILVSPEMEFRQTPDGRLLAPTAAGHQGDAATGVAAPPAELAETALARLRAALPGVAMDWETVTLAHRPVPGDGLPLAGPVPGWAGLHLAVMHSGVTLAALTGEALAAEVLGQGEHPALAPFRPERLLRPM